MFVIAARALSAILGGTSPFNFSGQPQTSLSASSIEWATTALLASPTYSEGSGNRGGRRGNGGSGNGNGGSGNGNGGSDNGNGRSGSSNGRVAVAATEVEAYRYRGRYLCYRYTTVAATRLQAAELVARGTRYPERRANSTAADS